MSFTLQGTGVSGGIAIGRAHLISHAHLEVSHYTLPQKMIPTEIQRFDAAIAATREELEVLRDSIPSGSPAEFGAFIDLHLMILADSTLSAVPQQIMEAQHCNAEWAFKQQMTNLLAQFDLQQLEPMKTPEGYFSEPFVIDPNMTFAVQVLTKAAPGDSIEVFLGNFVFEPTGQTNA